MTTLFKRSFDNHQPQLFVKTRAFLTTGLALYETNQVLKNSFGFQITELNESAGTTGTIWTRTISVETRIVCWGKFIKEKPSGPMPNVI